MAHVPQAWNDLVSSHRKAQVAHDAMRNPGVTGPFHDAVVIDHSRALDAMFDAMSRLSEAGDIGRITLLLSRKERA
jgi:hypothetical protein